MLANVLMPEFDRLMHVFAIHEVALDELADVSGKELFLHVLCMRFLQLGLVCIIAHTWKRFNFFLIGVVVCGFVFGMQTAVETMHFGVSGVLYSVSAWMPQIVFYGVAMYLLYVLFFKKPVYAFKKSDLAANGMKSILILAVLIVGCFVESFVNPHILYFIFVKVLI